MEQEVRNNILYLIENYGTTLAFLSKKSGLAKETISRFKTGKQQLSEETLIGFNQVLEGIKNN